ncbi:uncharacterized protein LOC132200656 [Neocloeon triangulifer]|uniref:uncharacterized protein LOC132200656 n=1 Tax=Neocloeon triangulifer TaxID=2078957 RepID=UPI00286EC7AD|nr:uncharacterized protein LOC132200656 [Neocloeon triangulifer]
MFHLRLVLLTAVLIFWLLQFVQALPHSRHHHAKNFLYNSAEKPAAYGEKHGGAKRSETAQQQRSNSSPAKMHSSDATSAADAPADYPASDFSDLSMWEYNIFPELPSNYEPGDADDYYDEGDYFADLQLENDYDEQGPTIQNLILLAATHPRRNRSNVFGLPPREVVIY